MLKFVTFWRITHIYGPSCITNTNKRTNVLLWQTTYYIQKISENKDINVLILAPLHTALTVQVYWSNEVDELDEVDEINELYEVESTQTVPE